MELRPDRRSSTHDTVWTTANGRSCKASTQDCRYALLFVSDRANTLQRVYGFCFVDDTPATPEATESLLAAIGPIRNTHYGQWLLGICNTGLTQPAQVVSMTLRPTCRLKTQHIQAKVSNLILITPTLPSPQVCRLFIYSLTQTAPEAKARLSTVSMLRNYCLTRTRTTTGILLESPCTHTPAATTASAYRHHIQYLCFRIMGMVF